MKANIIFPDGWLPYSPTIINLAKMLQSDNVDVAVYWVDDGRYGVEHTATWSRPIKINPLLARVLRMVRLFESLKMLIFLCVAITIRNKQSTFIGVDARGYIPARIANKKAIYLSLEAVRDFWFWWATKLGVESLIIQTEERARFLFPLELPDKVALLPNSPILDQATSRTERRVPTPGAPIRFIYFGNVIASHGVDACINAVLAYDDFSTITIHGPVSASYLSQLSENYGPNVGARIIFTDAYVDQNAVVEYLGGFDIGFVTYDFDRISSNDFNYLSCPSGKMYNFFTAGVPAIGLTIPGLTAIEEFAAGKLTKSLEPRDLVQAINSVCDDYALYRENALKAASHYDFRHHYLRNVVPLITP
ncbi:hypothetical protein ACFL33_03100 [Pseudomonadota bacterium]